jgi:hypothetical protein
VFVVCVAVVALVLLGGTCSLFNKAPSVPVVAGPTQGVAAGPASPLEESLASRWALRVDMPDTFCEDVTVRARLVLTNISGHSLQTGLRTGGLGRLPDRGVDMKLQDSMGRAVPRRRFVISEDFVHGPVRYAFRAGDSLCGQFDITSLCQESAPAVTLRPVKPGRYVSRATFCFLEWQGNSWRPVRLTSSPKTFVVTAPPDSVRDGQSLLRMVRAVRTQRDAQREDSAFSLLRAFLRPNQNSPYGPDAAVELSRALDGRWSAASHLSSYERDSIGAELVALFPNDFLSDYYAYEAWRCTPLRNRPVVLRVWRRVPSGTRLARLLDAYHADLK